MKSYTGSKTLPMSIKRKSPPRFDKEADVAMKQVMPCATSCLPAVSSADCASLLGHLQLKSLAHTMEAAPSAMRHALYEEAFRSICTALGQQQQQQQQQQKGCTDLGLEVPPHGATVTLRRAAKREQAVVFLAKTLHRRCQLHFKNDLFLICMHLPGVSLNGLLNFMAAC
eukprot:1142912-Pelagomonas_calceolata.AAC.15